MEKFHLAASPCSPLRTSSSIIIFSGRFISWNMHSRTVRTKSMLTSSDRPGSSFSPSLPQTQAQYSAIASTIPCEEQVSHKTKLYYTTTLNPSAEAYFSSMGMPYISKIHRTICTYTLLANVQPKTKSLEKSSVRFSFTRGNLRDFHGRTKYV